jgi:ketosteroid isomerase-like protein
MSERDVKVMEEFFACFGTGDIQGCIDRMHDDCVVVEAEGLPHSGTYYGGKGFGELVAKIGQLYSHASLADCQVYDAGDYVVARMIGTFTSRSNGLTVSMPVTEHYWLTDGKVSRADVYYKDPAGFDALVGLVREGAA